MHNQTDPADLANITTTTLGTGIFLVADVKSDDFGAMLKQFVEDLTYAACVLRGHFAFAFKWIPNDVESALTLRNASANCKGQFCVKTCKQRGCICNRARGMCQ